MANNFIAHGKNKRSGTRKRGRFVSPANPPPTITTSYCLIVGLTPFQRLEFH